MATCKLAASPLPVTASIAKANSLNSTMSSAQTVAVVANRNGSGISFSHSEFIAKSDLSAVVSASFHSRIASVAARPLSPICKTLPSRDGRKDVAIVLSAALDEKLMSRREAMSLSGAGLGAFLLVSVLSPVEGVIATEFTDMPGLRGKDYGKSKMSYPDYVQTESGLQYKDLREGVGPIPRKGDQVVIDWAGYTIGYYGKIFEARNKAKGGSFEGNEKGYFRFRVGEDLVIPAFEEAIKTMRAGGVRRIIVPSDIGYPNNDYNAKGPQPATFSGQRTLDFVLKNQGLIDKTLLFDIELLKVVQK